MKILSLLFFLIILTTPVAADNITIEIMLNSADEYYISYDDDLFSCDGDECTFEIEDFDGEYDLSNSDITKIAKRVAIEVRPTTSTECVNDTTLEVELIKVREDITDNIRSHITNTIVKDIDEVNELESTISLLEIDKASLESKVTSNDVIIEAYKIATDATEKENDRFESIALVEAIAILFLLITCTNNGKDLIENIKEFRRKR